MASNVIDFAAAKRAKKKAQRKPRAKAIAPHRGAKFGWQVLMAPPGLTLAQMARRDAVRSHASEML